MLCDFAFLFLPFAFSKDLERKVCYNMQRSPRELWDGRHVLMEVRFG